ncbi:UNVERIFIED_CONTAM: hypothetical protein NCL1_32879 [Trichonephila clavipes]
MFPICRGMICNKYHMEYQFSMMLFDFIARKNPKIDLLCAMFELLEDTGYQPQLLIQNNIDHQREEGIRLNQILKYNSTMDATIDGRRYKGLHYLTRLDFLPF